MCGRYANFMEEQALADAFAIAEVADDARLLAPSWNVAPSHLAAVVAPHPEGGRRRLVAAQWGLVPPWARDAAIGTKMFNARRESATEKPAFRSAFAKRRCLVPANGYFEWQDREAPPGRTLKQPFYIYPADGSPLALAGLWETRLVDDKRHFTFTILTTAAKGSLARIHDRRPVALTPDTWDGWLDASTPPHEVQAIAAQKGPPLALHAVGRDVGNVRINHAGLIAPIE